MMVMCHIKKPQRLPLTLVFLVVIFLRSAHGQAIEYNFDQTSYTVTEDIDMSAIIDISRNDTASNSSVDIVSSNDTAVDGLDYHAINTTVYFIQNDDRVSVNVSIIDNAVVQATRCFNLSLINPSSNGALGDNSTAEVCIIDDDDTEAPNVTCPNNITDMSTDSGIATAVVTWSPTPSATDNVDTISAASITCEDDADNVVMSGGTYGVGTTTVTCEVNDTALNEGSCQFTITIIDNEVPNVTCPNNITDMSTGSGVATAVVTWSPTPSATDNVDAISAASITCEDDADNVVMSGGTYGVGTTTVTCEVNDTALNEESCQFTITVIDTEAPSVSCPGHIPSITAGFGRSATAVMWPLVPSATDNVDTISAASITCVDDAGNVVMSGGTYAVGTTTVTCKVNDTALNEGPCQFTISVAACALTACSNEGTFDAEYCECVCPLTHSGITCNETNPCLSSPGTQCSDASTGQYCLPALNVNSYTCQCRTFDGLFLVSISCTSRPSITVIMRAASELFRAVYNNPTSTAFKVKIAVFEELVLLLLRADPMTSTVVSAHGTAIQSGSVIVTMVLEFPANEVPPRTDVIRVLSGNDLTDGIVTIPIDPTVTVEETTTDCEPDYCQYRGACVKSGYYFTQFTYTCSCETSFTGERCETVIPVSVQPTTDTSTTESPQDGLSTLAAVLIIVGCVVLLLAIVGLFLCFLFLRSGQFASDLPYSRPQRTPVARHAYSNHNTVSDDVYREDMRMDRLRHVISHSPYLQKGLLSHQEFIRPYVVSGIQGLRNDYPTIDDSVAGRVVYNPVVSY